MKAMILAAGLGKRLNPLTLTTPKPLIKIHNTTLIDHALHSLRDAGITDVVINVHHLGEQIIQHCGDGAAFGLHIQYSIEEELLETGGGIHRALPLLGQEPFLLLSADVWTDYPLPQLLNKKTKTAHLVFVDNPPFHPSGDYALDKNGIVLDSEKNKLTYANIGVINPILFSGQKDGVFRLFSLLRPLIQKGLVTGEYYHGEWHNVGTIKELEMLSDSLTHS